MSKLQSTLIAVLVIANIVSISLILKNQHDSLALLKTAQKHYQTLKTPLTTQANASDVLLSEQQLMNKMIMEKLADISANISLSTNDTQQAHTSNSSTNVNSNNYQTMQNNHSEPPVADVYQPSQLYSEEEIESAKNNTQTIVENAISSATWSEEDMHKLLEYVPYLNQQQKDELREQLLTAVNKQNLKLDTALIIPF